MMKRIVEGSLEQYGKLYSPFFFNTEEFLSGQNCPGRKNFGLYYEKRDVLLAQLTLFTENQNAYSPCKGSFGGYVLSEKIKTEDLISFIQQIEKRLQDVGLEEITIRQFPECYSYAQAALLAYCLTVCGYERKTSDLNYHINLLGKYEDELRQSEPARIKAAEHAGFTFKQEESSSADEVYCLLKLSRNAQGYPVTMDSVSFQNLFKKFPDWYRLFSLFHGSCRIAFAVVVKISETICYCFYLGERPDYRKYSPVAYLTWKLVQELKTQGYTLLDLGIATENGIPNFGLQEFKQNMGGIPSLRLTWKKQF